MKVRLTSEETQRLRALCAAHPEHIRSLRQALTAAIKHATQEAFADAEEQIEAHTEARVAAWAKLREDSKKRRQPMRVRRPKSNIQPPVRQSIPAPSLGGRPAGSPRPGSTSAARNAVVSQSVRRVREGPPEVYKHKPTKAAKERDNARANRMNAWLYHRNAEAYREGRHRAWAGAEFEAWRDAKRAEVEADRDL